MRNFFDLDPDGLAAMGAELGWARYRVSQLLDAVYRHGATSWDQVTTLPKAMRAELAGRLRLGDGEVIQRQDASDGVVKLLVAWPDAGKPHAAGPGDRAAHSLPLAEPPADPAPRTECVMIPAAGEKRDRRTACISSQVGCPVGCRFCASGLGGLEGDLSAGRIVEQVWRLSWLRDPATGSPAPPITHVVFMGMGEPLANFAAVTGAVRRLTADWGLGLSARRITISTVGLPAQIRRLAEIDLPITLAISLHAPTDALRRELIPWAESVSVDQLVDAGRFYFDRTGREITLEYILLRGVNDRPAHAAELARVAGRLRSNVNLIRYNEVADLPYERPRDDDVRAFQQKLREAGVNVHIRASRGRDIAAACGQLRHEQRAQPAADAAQSSG